MKIPVFHDDQHGTAIISSAAILNGLKVVNKDIGSVKLACSGAGAAAIACLDLLVHLGVKRENIYVVDSRGVIWDGRDENMEANKKRYAQKTDARTLADVVNGADVFLGCSTAGVLTADMVKTMADRPLILALATPSRKSARKSPRPRVPTASSPPAVRTTRTRSTTCCASFIFRGAMDAGASRITEEMKLACVKAIADLAQAEQNDEVARAYAGQELSFGPDYIIPKPFDPRLIVQIAPAVAQAAAESGVAARPIEDIEAYRQKLMGFVYHSGQLMRRCSPRRRRRQARHLRRWRRRARAARRADRHRREAGPAHPDRPPSVIEMRIKKFGLRMTPGVNRRSSIPRTTAASTKPGTPTTSSRAARA